jgi:ribosomal 50S subunit-associated protein YjgA (DUF615 family)
MSEYQIQIGDEVRDMTDEEIAQRDKDVAEMNALTKERADLAKLKTATLAKLGLTADEVAALLS